MISCIENMRVRNLFHSCMYVHFAVSCSAKIIIRLAPSNNPGQSAASVNVCISQIASFLLLFDYLPREPRTAPLELGPSVESMQACKTLKS